MCRRLVALSPRQGLRGDAREQFDIRGPRCVLLMIVDLELGIEKSRVDRELGEASFVQQFTLLHGRRLLIAKGEPGH